jgi:hypothetical protein
MLETKKKNLIICGACEANGTKSILGELNDDGEFLVQRFHQGFTIIKSPVYAVICGGCHGTVFIRNEGTILPNSGTWIHREQTTVSFRGTVFA